VVTHNQTDTENSGFDIYVASESFVPRQALPTCLGAGIHAEMIEDDGSSGGYWLVARSSICDVPLRLYNAPGVIDPGYRGQIRMMVTPTLLEGRGVQIPQGARYFQLVHPSLKPFQVRIVSELSPSARGVGGFGSTGSGGKVTVI